MGSHSQLTLVLGLCLTLTPCSALENSVPDEWIVTQGAERSFKTFETRLLPHFHFKKFGPGGRFTLLKKKSKSSFTLPSEIRKHLQPNYLYHALDLPDPDFSKSWALENTGKNEGEATNGKAGADVDAKRAWQVQPSSPNTLVAILDSGVDLLHPDLQKNLWRNTKEVPANKKDDDGNGLIDDAQGWDFVDDTNNIQDGSGHGSLVASILAAESQNGKGTRGITQGPFLMLRVLDNTGTGTTERGVRAIQYAVDKGAQIINISWGGIVYDPALYETVSWAQEKGILIVAASGNMGRNNDTEINPYYPASYRLKNIISVAAYDNQNKIATFSNFGKETVHIGAPGVAIFGATKDGKYRFNEGTSFAAPLVAGVAALLKEKAPSLTAAGIKERLIRTANPIDYYEKEKTQSGGLLNAYYALINFEAPRPPTPTEWQSHKTLIASLHPYTNSFADTYEIVHKGASHIRVHFSRFELEQKYDWLRVLDKRGKEIVTYTGQLGEFMSADALGDTLRIEFKTDNRVTHWGWEVDSYEVHLAP
jgi:thermitase